MLIPIPTNEELQPQPTPIGISRVETERIKRYMDCPDWKCGACGAVMFGRCKECVYCRVRLNTHTPKPE